MSVRRSGHILDTIICWSIGIGCESFPALIDLFLRDDPAQVCPGFVFTLEEFGPLKTGDAEDCFSDHL